MRRVRTGRCASRRTPAGTAGRRKYFGSTPEAGPCRRRGLNGAVRRLGLPVTPVGPMVEVESTEKPSMASGHC
jgi:hypothetical protein